MKIEWLNEFGTSLRLIVVTMAVCCVIYPLIIFGVGQAFTPYTASGWLLYNQAGKVIGSEIIAQSFSRKEYFWPRPSAVDYNASGSGGSNLSPANPELRKRALATMAKYGATSGIPIPVDLVTASGSGLDPYITMESAKYQIARIAAARQIAPERLTVLIEHHIGNSGKLVPLVNVLQLNLELNGISHGGGVGK